MNVSSFDSVGGLKPAGANEGSGRYGRPLCLLEIFLSAIGCLTRLK